MRPVRRQVHEEEMEMLTRCVLCGRQIEASTEPSVRIPAGENGARGDVYAHFRCYGKQSVPSSEKKP
jgi:hypothetical protein